MTSTKTPTPKRDAREVAGPGVVLGGELPPLPEPAGTPELPPAPEPEPVPAEPAVAYFVGYLGGSGPFLYRGRDGECNSSTIVPLDKRETLDMIAAALNSQSVDVATQDAIERKAKQERLTDPRKRAGEAGQAAQG